MKSTRRTFIKTSLSAAAAISLPARVRAQAEGANGDLRVAVVGFNGRGYDHIGNYSRLKGTRLVALCDIDTAVLERGAGQMKAKGQDVETFQDIRKLLEKPDVDVISIATPNHWHSLAAIWSIQAGKDVYVEKPVSHNVWEGRQLVKCADAHNRIVQMGVQSRSAYGLAAAVEWAKAGNLGKIKYARGLCYKPRMSIGKADADLEIPPTIDFDLWCGPAEKLPIHRKNFHYDWHWVWNTGNGDIGNQGIHQMDIARRFLGESALAPRVFSVGGRLGYVDDGETPNSLFVVHEYEKAPLIFEVRGLPKKPSTKPDGLWGAPNMDRYRGASVGVVVQYEGGHILCPDYNIAIAYDKDDKEIQKFAREPAEAAANPDEENHYLNFLTCVRSRKAADLNGKIIDGHISSALCHTGNISHRLGKKATPGAIREAVKANADALDSLDRLTQHLGANEVNLDTDQLTLGEFLKMDPTTEKFVGNAEADKLLTRDYRAPYVVPEKV